MRKIICLLLLREYPLFGGNLSSQVLFKNLEGERLQNQKL